MTEESELNRKSLRNGFDGRDVRRGRKLANSSRSKREEIVEINKRTRSNDGRVDVAFAVEWMLHSRPFEWGLGAGCRFVADSAEV